MSGRMHCMLAPCLRHVSMSGEMGKDGMELFFAATITKNGMFSKWKKAACFYVMQHSALMLSVHGNTEC